MSEVNEKLYIGSGLAIGAIIGLSVTAEMVHDETWVEQCQNAVYEYEDLDSLSDDCGDLIVSNVSQSYLLEGQTITPASVNVETARVVVDNAVEEQKTDEYITGFVLTIGAAAIGACFGAAAAASKAFKKIGKEETEEYGLA